MKRSFDLIFAIILIVVFAPLLIVTALVVLFTMGKPVIFRQDRPGHLGRIFTLYKFRTMKGSRGNTSCDAERLTPVGKFMRSTSLDELPELLNVLKGDMSFVGPRPLLSEYLELYNSHQARRHEVKPGITGWAQVNGRNGISWEEKFDLDVWYVDNHSFILDLKILLMTVAVVFRREGISHAGEVTMSTFTGSKHEIAAECEESK